MEWGLGEISLLRSMRANGVPVNRLVHAWQGSHTRNEVIEAIWATIRCDTDASACLHANMVLSAQRHEIPLVNGRPWAPQAKAATYPYRPDF